MPELKHAFTSTGAKFFAHQEAMTKLRNGVGQPIVTHVMATDLCAHSCAFCSVHHREGFTLPYHDILSYLDILVRFGLKAVILSGGGNPILYKCPKTRRNFDDLVTEIALRGLEIGLITDGMPLKDYDDWTGDYSLCGWKRSSWRTVRPETLDKLKWIRISMAGLDHEENEVFVPDVDPEKTTLGFSYVGHDIHTEPLDKAHGKVSTTADMLTLGTARLGLETRWMKDRIPELTEQIGDYVRRYNPKYVRLLPNCLEVDQIQERCGILQEMANKIDPNVVFVQYKPPAAPKACYLGYIHPVLNTDGYVFPCDSCVLNVAADHKFANPWRICHWSEIAKIYEEPVRSLIRDPQKQCPGCVFTASNTLLGSVVDGTADLTPPETMPVHHNFV
jgi:hypothetical protein